MYSVQRSKNFLVGGRYVKTINIKAPINFFSDWFLVVHQLYLPGRYRSIPRRSEQRHLSGWLQGQVHFVFDTRVCDSIPNVFKFNSCDDCHLEVCIVCSNIYFFKFPLWRNTPDSTLLPCCQPFSRSGFCFLPSTSYLSCISCCYGLLTSPIILLVCPQNFA